MEHFIDTLDDADLAEQLVMHRLESASALEDLLRARQRSQEHLRKEARGSAKYRQRSATPARDHRPVNALRVDAENDGADSTGDSDMEDLDDVARVFAAVRAPEEGDLGLPLAISEGERARDRLTGEFRRCTHCGSTRHTDLGCWQRLTCQKCGKKGHPSDRCLHVCKCCGAVHEAGECKMEEFFNLLRQWYDPQKHAGMLPPPAEKLLN